MTATELIQYKSHEVRRDSDLMASYVKLFSEIMGYTPNCAGCTFKNDWTKFVKAVSNSTELQLQKTNIMATKSFELKKARKTIHTYKKDGRPVRSYNDNMTEEFAIAFLTHGTEEQIEERKKLFKKLPDLGQEVKTLDKMNRAELDKEATDRGLNPADYKNKGEVLKAIQEHDAEKQDPENTEDDPDGSEEGAEEVQSRTSGEGTEGSDEEE